MGVSCIVYSIARKIGLIGEQNVTNHTGVRINPTAQIQPATHVRRFRMLNALDVVQIHSFCEQRSPDCHARNTEAGRNSSCTSAWTSLYHVNNVFIILHISLCLTFSMEIYTWKEPFSCRCWCTRVNTCLSGIRRRGYRSRYSSTAAVVLPLQNPYMKCLSAYSS